MASNFGTPKKQNISELIPFIVGAAAAVTVCTWAGYVVEMTAAPKGGVNLLKALNSLSEYASPSAFLNAFGAVFTGNGIAKRGMLIGIAAGMLLILYKLSGSGKRFHRRGTEHGSARWGSRQEKDIIADTRDFYNNVIAASDVFLVLDRKKREQNAMSERERKAKEKAEKKKSAADEKRINEITAKIQKDSPVGNFEKDFETDKNTLIKYRGKEKYVTLPDNISAVGDYAFALSDIKEVYMPNVKSIGKGAFFGCENLEKAEMQKVRNIDSYAFENCYRLTDIYIGKALHKAHSTSFAKCLNVVFHGAGGYGEQYANQQDIAYENDGASLDNEVISVKKVAEMRKAAAKIKPMLNLNMIILGGSGTGKSRFYVKPNLMQCNTSFVVTDPSGELLQSCGMMLIRRGYKIKVFNINDMKHSSNYNPFHYLKDSKGEFNSNNVIKMINVFMMNTKEEGAGTGDQFWSATRSVLKRYGTI